MVQDASYTLTIYTLWDLKCTPISPRSYLYQLEPVGIGTPSVESLTSFIARLAEAHCVRPGILMSRELAPLIKKLYVKSSANMGLSALFNRASALNGTGEMATDWVNVLEELTQQNNLQSLTLLSYAEVFTTRGLLRDRKAWCPACYQEWYILGQTVYEPLLWSIHAVKVCLKHNQPLWEYCPHCEQQLRPLDWQSRPGYCSNCEGWLGILANTDFSPIELLSEWDNWVANSVGELIVIGRDLSSPLSYIRVRKAICATVDILTEGNIAAFASFLGMPKNTVWSWYAGKALPSLNALLKVSYCLKISLLNFLRQEIEATERGKKLVQAFQTLQRTPRMSPRSFDSSQVQELLSKILADSKETPPTMTEVAKTLGYDRRILLKHFPDLCYAIVAKCRTHRRYIHEKAVQKYSQEVQQAVFTLHKNGEFPTEARVSELISKPGYFRYKKVRAAFSEARRQLGLETEKP